MKKWFLPVQFLLLFACCLSSETVSKQPSASSLETERQAPESSLPEEISDFYKKWNFVSALSTLEEKTILLNCIDRQKEPPDRLMKKERIKKVYESIKELDRYELPGIDPDFVRSGTNPEFVFPKASQSPKKSYDRVFDIHEARKANGRISVMTISTCISPALSEFLIAKYEKNEKMDNHSGIEGPRFKKNSEPFSGVISPNISRKELHIWRLVDGKWMREESSYLLLNAEQE